MNRGAATRVLPEPRVGFQVSREPGQVAVAGQRVVHQLQRSQMRETVQHFFAQRCQFVVVQHSATRKFTNMNCHSHTGLIIPIEELRSTYNISKSFSSRIDASSMQVNTLLSSNLTTKICMF